MTTTDTDFEREFAELVAELRAAPTTAPPALRERVRALGEPERRGNWPVPRINARRALLLGAPACVAALLSVAIVRGVLVSDKASRPQAQTAAKMNPRDATLTTPVWGESGSSALTAGIAPPAGGRAVDYDASLRVRVRDEEALSDRSAEAMRIARALGGYVASVQQSTARGQAGEADLVLRIPVARIEDALIRLAGLGTVVEQHVSIVDLQQTLDQQARRIRLVRLQIARLRQALRDPALGADERLNLQFQLQEARARLARLTGANRATLREAALSEVSLALTTRRVSGAVATDDEGRFERAVRNAGEFLAAAGAVALFLLIAVSPLAVLAAAFVLATRAHRRREERRLLAATSD